MSARVARLRRVGVDLARVEVKAAAGGLPKSTGETLSAFVNGSGGELILGLSESAGFRPTDGFDASAIRDAVAGLCADEMEPPIRTDIEIVPFEGALVIYLDVPAGDPLLGPCHIRRRGAYGGSYIRGGDGDRRLTAYEVTQMLSNRGQPVDDSAVVAGATLDDLDPILVGGMLQRLRGRATRAFQGIDDTAALIRAGAATADSEGTARPTLAGLLCLGRFPQQFVPQLFVSFVALPGMSLGDAMDDGTRFLDNVTCDGTIPQMLDAVLVAARRNMRTAAVIRDAGREDRFDYPVEVIRELVVNALLHRDYSPGSRGSQVQVEMYPDRLVVKSPGGLYGNVVPSQLGVEEVSSTRNAALARLLADIPDAEGMPVSENRGSGLPRVMTRLRKAGMSPPGFNVAPGHVHVTVPQHALLDPPTIEWIAGLSDSTLTDQQHIALALMRNTGAVSNEMLRAWGIESHAATAALRGLVERGLAVKSGGRRYAIYEFTEQTEPPMLPAAPATGGDARGFQSRRERIDSELQAVVEAIRAGHDTTSRIREQLGLEYTTVTRRINALLKSARIEETAAPHSRYRSFIVREADNRAVASESSADSPGRLHL
ncbi:MAG: ATP-binding protein [Candidatus Nanopelagicales bacterium]